MSDRAAWIELAHGIEPADGAAARLLASVGPDRAVDLIRSGRSGLRHGEGIAARMSGVTAEQAEDRAHAAGTRIVTRVDRDWPTQLDALGAMVPMALWVMGAASLRLLALRSVAVVGARASSPYGEELARSWSADLAAEGWTIVSGAAFGVDAAAHRGALAAGGVTMALLAGGVDVPYPRAHAALLGAIADQGLVVSEVPLGEPVRRQRFLSRNRLIAALGRATLVVEAAERSGTAATAHQAAALLRPVLAVPGPVTAPTSVGCHRLIQEGTAMLATGLPDVMAALDLDAGSGRGADAHGPTGSGEVRRRDHLDATSRRVLDSMPARRWATAAELVRASGLAPADMLAAAARLAVDGWLVEGPNGWRRVREPAA